MKITIAVDAQPFFSALLGGAARKIFFDPRFRFITTDFTLSEVKHYIHVIAEKSGKQDEMILEALNILPITTYHKADYQEKRSIAEQLIGTRDPKDIDILALVLTTRAILWTEDKDFEDIPGISIVHTKDLL
jgi:predicted nucleic acid-binding protein